MKTLLRIDSSPTNAASVSRYLTDQFVEKWRTLQPDGEVITRDLTHTDLLPIAAEWIGASYTPESSRTAEQKQVLSLSDALVSELQDADEYVIGVPMHNFSIPATLKLWIDQIARAGKTFAYADGRPKGLLGGKRATFLVASGGVYDPGTAMASFNFVEPYLRTLFAFLGITETTFINAGGTAQMKSSQLERGAFLKSQLDAIEARLQPLEVRN
jgi:FMN-dependent NADH-azoreductase